MISLIKSIILVAVTLTL